MSVCQATQYPLFMKAHKREYRSVSDYLRRYSDSLIKPLTNVFMKLFYLVCDHMLSRKQFLNPDKTEKT